MKSMSEIDGPAREPQRNHCSYPGCTRPRRPDPSTGRPTRYCEQADEAGGPVHNRANAWKARRAREGAVTALDSEATAAPVSLARATLDQRLAELPERFADLRHYLDGVVADIRDAGDIEAAGAEVEDAHRDALAKITEAERRTAAAERTARLAHERIEQAERDREEADLLAEESAAETDRVREEAQAEIAAVRADADAAVELAHGNWQMPQPTIATSSPLAPPRWSRRIRMPARPAWRRPPRSPLNEPPMRPPPASGKRWRNCGAS